MHRQSLTGALLLFATQISALAAPAASIDTGNASTSAKCWYGNDFPAETNWLSFDALFEKWRPDLQAQGDTEQELNTMKDALQKYSQQGGFDPALAMAMMIQESHGNTCSSCGDGGISCGLLQVHGAPNSCANGAHPCPDATIQKGIECGAVGCDGGYGNSIKSCVASQGQQWGAVLRCYNSGSVTDPNNLRVITYGNPVYVQNVANILLGADFAEVEQLSGSGCGF
ncbi:uncharacterized protein F4822DRAFT_294199 [Hypoxylon trugodes]|uniref:uncharacterized protein n=1 Tax=Hypoxylon trugodes TaxID=326681 RepID=UPI00219E93AA|nr:uncharacterized protein F4822DRAFT_294199 [Hypoxylon trugodes]KAI1387847.1 hypothetical protein F4822DRAFT_294199 [Hypoxylon trugodes]